MKIIFIILMCLSFFGCSKNQKTDEIVQNTESEVIEIEEEIKVDEEIKLMKPILKSIVLKFQYKIKRNQLIYMLNLKMKIHTAFGLLLVAIFGKT